MDRITLNNTNEHITIAVGWFGILGTTNTQLINYTKEHTNINILGTVEQPSLHVSTTGNTKISNANGISP